MLNKNDILFERNDSGQLIPQTVTLVTLDDKPTVKIVPLTRGQLQEVYTKAKSENASDRIESDNSIIKLGLIEPVLSDDEIKCLKPKFSTAISIAILSVSLDVPQEEVGNKIQDTISTLSEQELELKKK